MKKLVKPSTLNSHIYLYESGGYNWKLSMWLAPGCNGYWIRCELPGNNCDHIIHATCFPY